MNRIALPSLAVAALALSTGVLSAQGRHVFVVDQAASAFTYSGTATIPSVGTFPITAVPDNKFNLKGTLDSDLSVSGGVATSGALVPGGSSTTVPQLSAVVIVSPFLPPAASIDITGLQIEFLSVDPITLLPKSFPIVGGNFSTDVSATLLAGTATITLVTGGTTIIDLTGEQSPAQFVSGTISSTATGFHLNVPVNLPFSFSDSTGSITGNITLVGTGVADYRPLNSDSSAMSIAAGGTQTLILSTGGALPLNPYLVVGSETGTSPGIPIGPGQVLPLNFSPLLTYTLEKANQPPFSSTFGNLDGNGKATAGFTLPPATVNPALAGTTIHWAYVVIDIGAGGAIGFISNPEPLLLQP